MIWNPLIFGIDPSIAATGIALPDGQSHTVKTRPKDGDKRLRRIHGMVNGHLDWYGQEEFGSQMFAVIEDLPMNAKSAGLTGMAQGVIRERLAYYEVPVARVAPASLKKFATGSGRADKADMRAAWLEFSGHDIADDNQVDALWLRQMGVAAHAVHEGMVALEDLPDHEGVYVKQICQAFGWELSED